MASFQKRGNTWQFTISRMVNGKYKPIRKGGFKTKKEAQVAAAEIEQKLNRGLLPHLKPEPFDQYFAEWLDTYKRDISPNTRARYLSTLKTLQEYCPGKPIQECNKRWYQEFLNWYAETHTKESTRKLHIHIRACVRDAIDEGLIHVDFTRGAVISGEKPSKTEDEKYLNYFEARRLMKAIEKPTCLSHYIILLGLTSGMRFAEMVGLTREDFDFKNNTIRVNKTWGYTNKMHEGFGPTKNGKSRVIKMSPKIMRIFREFFKTVPDNIHRLVFYEPGSKYKVISNNAVNKTLRETLKRLNIEPITVHGLRHTHASILLYRRVSIYYVADRLGDEVETINKHYAHIIKELREEDEQNTIEIMDEMAV